MPRNPYKTIVLGGLGLGAVAGVGALVAAALGVINVSARAPHLGVTTFALHNVFKASVGRASESVAEAPDLTDPGLITLGAQHYAQVCASCHGGPGLGQSPVALSMRPRPQSLPAVVDQFDDRELYTILRDGVRFSAMPSWPADGNFGEIWSVVAFLRQLPDMTAEDYADLTRLDTTTGPDTAQFAWQERGPAQDLTLHYMAPPIEEYLYQSPSTGWRQIGLNDAPVAYCAACHGDDGTGAVTGGHAPNLTLHSPEFIAERLRGYANGRNASGIMATVASSLSGPQIDALADYYGSLPATPVSTAQEANVDMEIGRDIATLGLPDQAIPACATCHSAEGQDAWPRMPAIAGQSAAFLKTRLTSFQDDTGSTGPTWNPMHAFAQRLDADQIDAVAGYLSTLSPNAPFTAVNMRPNPDLVEQTLSATCVTCHDESLTGRATEIIPNLTLQGPDYIKWQLELFKTGQRDNTQMREVAQRLDPEQIEALAHDIGNRQPLASQTVPGWEPVGGTALVAAEELVLNGDPDRGLPACRTCHTDATQAIAIIPRLAGQQPDYLNKRLEDFAAIGAGDDDVGNAPMTLISQLLTRDERKALAEYFADAPMTPKP